jgi:hypothetical protein
VYLKHVEKERKKVMHLAGRVWNITTVGAGTRCAFCHEVYGQDSEVLISEDEYFCDEQCFEEYEKLGAELSYAQRYDLEVND